MKNFRSLTSTFTSTLTLFAMTAGLEDVELLREPVGEVERRPKSFLGRKNFFSSIISFVVLSECDAIGKFKLWCNCQQQLHTSVDWLPAQNIYGQPQQSAKQAIIVLSRKNQSNAFAPRDSRTFLKVSYRHKDISPNFNLSYKIYVKGKTEWFKAVEKHVY